MSTRIRSAHALALLIGTCVVRTRSRWHAGARPYKAPAAGSKQIEHADWSRDENCGVHNLDVPLHMGDIVSLVRHQAQAYQRSGS